MILWFNQVRDKRGTAIKPLRGFHGNLGYFFAVMEKLGKAPFLWWSEILRVMVDFEKNELVLRVEGRRIVEHSISFEDWLQLGYPELVAKYMRPLSAAIARSWDLPKTADVIENGATRDQIRAVLYDESDNAKWEEIALTNILYEDADVPWKEHGFR